MSAAGAHLIFASPRALPPPGRLEGRVVVLDIAFAGTSGSHISFDKVTKPFIEGLGQRLAVWVDHHDHERHGEFSNDNRFVLATKAEHGACPEMIHPDLVRQVGPIDTIVTHLDLDGLYSAAKWILGGVEPYKGADDDARCVDTRTGTPGRHATLIDQALRAKFRDADLKRAVVLWLTTGMNKGPLYDTILEAEKLFHLKNAGTERLARRFVHRGRVAYVDASTSTEEYDKTELLLQGQRQAQVSAVRDAGAITIAAAYDSGWDFVQLLGLEGGMPTRVTVPEARLDEALSAINEAPEPSRPPQ